MRLSFSKVLYCLGLLTLTCSSLSAQNIETSFSNGTFQADFRTFYFNGSREQRQDREALAVGGIFKYTTKAYEGLSAGIGFYTSHDLLHRGSEPTQRINNASVSIDTSDIGGNSELIQSNGDAIDTLGEVYLQYDIASTSLRIGRQRLNTPMLNDYYNRFLPNSFEALSLVNSGIDDTVITLAVVDRWKYKAEEEFKSLTASLGVDENLFLIGLENSSLSSVKLSAWYYRLNNVYDTLYTSLQHKQLAVLRGGWKIDGALQYIKQDASGDKLLGKLDTYLFGAKLTLSQSNFSWTLMTDRIGNDTIRGSGTDYNNYGFSKFVNFTDIQIDGEALNAGAVSYGTNLQYHFSSNFKSALKYVHIKQNDTMQLASSTPNKRPSSDEWNIDMSYKTDNTAKLRLRLAYIDYEKNAIITNEYDEINLRLIYDFRFQVN